MPYIHPRLDSGIGQRFSDWNGDYPPDNKAATSNRRSAEQSCVKRSLSKRPKIGFQDQLPLLHFAILSTFIKLPVVIQIFVLSIYFEWPFFKGFTVTSDTSQVLVNMMNKTAKYQIGLCARKPVFRPARTSAQTDHLLEMSIIC